jgi:hypothetical protein
MSLPKEYLSASQISMLLRCGEQYRRRYIEGEIIPPGISLLKGSACHKGIEVNNTQKIQSRTDMSKCDIVEISVVHLENKIKTDGLELNAEEKTIGKDKVIGDAKDEVVSLAGLYADEIAPNTQPIMAEKEINIPVGDQAVKGFIDCIDDKKRVRDYKTSGRSKNQKELESSLQMAIYTVAYEQEFGELPAGICYDVLISTKKPKYQLIELPAQVNVYSRLGAVVETVIKSIKSGVFLPAAEGSWLCNPLYCGYYNTCKYVKHDMF